MDRKKAIKILTLFREEWDRHSKTPNAKALDMAIEALQEPERKWIPVTYHTPKDKDEDMLYAYILDCPMPEEGQEILVSFNGVVDMDICCYDEGWYLDNRGDWSDVDAWMPLPEPYKSEEREKDEE